MSIWSPLKQRNLCFTGNKVDLYFFYLSKSKPLGSLLSNINQKLYFKKSSNYIYRGLLEVLFACNLFYKFPIVVCSICKNFCAMLYCYSSRHECIFRNSFGSFSVLLLLSTYCSFFLCLLKHVEYIYNTWFHILSSKFCHRGHFWVRFYDVIF